MRVLALLVVTILAAGAHVEALAAVPTAAASSDGGTEHDVLDTGLRPPARQEHGPLVPLRPAPGPAHDHPESAPRPRHVPPSYSRTLHALRSVVLRC